MKKAFIFCCISLCMIFCFGSVYAKTDTFASISEDGVLTVNISSDAKKDTLYTVYLVKSDADLLETEENGELFGILKIEQIKLLTNSENEYNFVSLIKNVAEIEKDKAYKVVIGGGELYKKTIDVIYPSQTKYNEAVNELKSADGKDVNSILKKYQNTAWIIDLDNEDYKNNFTKANENLVSIIQTNNDVNQSFVNAVQLAKLSSCQKSEIINILLENESNFNITYTDVVKNNNQSFVDAFDALRKDSIVNPLLNVLDLSNILRRAEALSALNEATRENLISTLKKYNDVFKLDFDGNYKLVDSYELTKKMVANDNPYTSIKAVSSKFTSSVLALIPPSGGASSGGGGSKVGSSSFGSVGIASGVLTPPIVESVNKNTPFTDINEAAWAKAYIQYMQDRNIMSGDGDGKVRPNDKVKREEFLKMLIEALNLNAGENDEFSVSFDDVSENDWHAKYVKDAILLKIVNGLSDNIFGTGTFITREDAAVMMYRASESGKNILNTVNEEKSFTDYENISDYAKISVKSLQVSNIISGYETGEFLPKKSITRAEAAKLIYSLLKNLGKL